MPDLAAAVQAHRNLVERVKSAFPEETEETLVDSIDAATELDGAIVAVLRTALEREAMAEAMAGLIETMGKRKKRLEDGAKAMKAACLQAMQDVGWPRLPAPIPDMTVRVDPGKPKVVITHEDAVPTRFCKIARTPQKKEIGEELAAGRRVPGATLGNPQPFLVINRR